MPPASRIKKSEFKRLAEIVREDGVRIEVKVGEMVITVLPDTTNPKDSGIDYGRPSL